MSFKLFDRIQETTSTSGTGSFSLSGSAPTSFRTFASVFSNGDTTYYLATDGTNWEVGLGTYTTSGNSLARTTIVSSSNSNSPVAFPGPNTNVLCTLPGPKIILLDSVGALNVTLKQIGEVTNAVTATTGTTTLDLSLGGVQLLTLQANTALTFSNPLATGTSSSFLLKAIQDGTGNRTITWPGSVVWAGGIPPTISTGANKKDFFSFNTVDAGTTWFGFIGGIGY